MRSTSASWPREWRPATKPTSLPNRIATRAKATSSPHQCTHKTSPHTCGARRRRRHMPRKKILLVDDSSTILMMEKFILRNGPYILITATNGEEAVTKAVTEQPDLILLDVIMPRMGGFEA